MQQNQQREFQGSVVRRVEAGAFRFSETYYPAGAFLPAHSHNRWYLCFVRRGCYEETFDGRTRFCQPFTVAGHPAGETHSERFRDTPTYSFNLEGPGDLRRPTVLLGGEPAQLAAELYQAFSNGNRESLESLSWELLALTESTGKPLRGEPAWLTIARQYIEDLLPQSLQLAAIAAMVQVKPAHLATAFRRVHGCTAGEYLLRLRIERACRQLAHNTSLADIALDCGFCDQSHLTRTFRQRMGVTPAAYRAML